MSDFYFLGMSLGAKMAQSFASLYVRFSNNNKKKRIFNESECVSTHYKMYIDNIFSVSSGAQLVTFYKSFAHE